MSSTGTPSCRPNLHPHLYRCNHFIHCMQIRVEHHDLNYWLQVFTLKNDLNIPTVICWFCNEQCSLLWPVAAKIFQRKHKITHFVCCTNPTDTVCWVQVPSGLVYSTWEMSKGTFLLSSINVISNLDKMKETLRSLGKSSIQHCWDSRQRCVWHLIFRRIGA